MTREEPIYLFLGEVTHHFVYVATQSCRLVAYIRNFISVEHI